MLGKILAPDVLDSLLCQEYHAKHPGKPGPRPRGRPRGNPVPRVSSLEGGCCYVNDRNSVAFHKRSTNMPSNSNSQTTERPTNMAAEDYNTKHTHMDCHIPAHLHSNHTHLNPITATVCKDSHSALSLQSIRSLSFTC